MEEELDDVIEQLYKCNSKKFNFRKAAEELNELSLVLLQYLNKEQQPNEQAIIDEIGDVGIRVAVVAKYFNENLISKRVDDKLTKLKSYIETNKYKNV
jgi:hypothetical protein